MRLRRRSRKAKSGDHRRLAAHPRNQDQRTLENADPPNEGDGPDTYLAHAECPVVLQAESVDDAVDTVMRMAAEGYFNHEFEPRYEVRVEGPVGSTPAWEAA